MHQRVLLAEGGYAMGIIGTILVGFGVGLLIQTLIRMRK
jgi:hypothetical protein